MRDSCFGGVQDGSVSKSTGSKDLGPEFMSWKPKLFSDFSLCGVHTLSILARKKQKQK